MVQMPIDYQIVLLDLPTNEAVTINEDGSYTIFINARLTKEQQIKSYYHAMKHILGEDFEKLNVQEIEKEAHG